VLLLVLRGAAFTTAQEVAVIVHPANRLEALSIADLREILLMERQHWAIGARIYVLLPETGTPEKDLLLEQVLKMKETELKRHYLAKLYAGEIPSFPRIASSNPAARRTVARAANAIAVVETTELDDTVKVLRIDGRRPGEAGYILATSHPARRGRP
jgi:hypothetical protein